MTAQSTYARLSPAVHKCSAGAVGTVYSTLHAFRKNDEKGTMDVSKTYVILQKQICALYLHVSGIDNVTEGFYFTLMVVVYGWVLNYEMWKVTPKMDLVAIETIRSVKNTQTIYRQHPEEIHIC